MADQNAQIERLPGNSFSMQVKVKQPSPHAPVAVSEFTPFEKIKHLLSKRPIHLPRRPHPST